ncbi:MAG: hypothetical protein ACJ8FI_03020 [Sphingomicrobium sp.]
MRAPPRDRCRQVIRAQEERAILATAIMATKGCRAMRTRGNRHNHRLQAFRPAILVPGVMAILATAIMAISATRAM